MKEERDLSLREPFLNPELLSECPILSKKLHSEWTKIRGLGQAEDAEKTAKSPIMLSAAELGKYAGDYGPRHVTLREGRLYYQREGRPEFLLLPLTRDTFALEKNVQFRVRFVSDSSGRITKLVGLYIQGNTDESPRDR